MRKQFFLFIACVFFAQCLVAKDIQPSVTLSTYYSAADGKSGEAIRTALHNKISAHTTVGYDALGTLFKWTDTYNNEGKVIDDIYSYCDPNYTSSWCSGDCGYNREHSVPKSWFNEKKPLYSDAFHLYPTNCYVNSYRGNYAFGECANGTKCTTNGISAKGRRGTSTFTGYTNVGTVYEPDDEFKGDLARTYFYMVTCYMNDNFTQADGGAKMFTYSGGTAQLSNYSVALLLKWHRQDPVSERELVRNEVIYGNSTYNKCNYKQGNRNPFIDYPELAEYIWGTKKGQTLTIASIVSAYDSDGTTPVDPTPTPVTIKYGITFMVNGQELRTDSVVENAQPTSLPATPTSCSTESNIFVGWTTTPISGTTDVAPKVLYTQAKQIPALKDDLTLYATFAKKQTTQTGQVAQTEKLDFSTGYSNGQDVTGKTQGGVTVAFSKASGSNPPKYYTSGNAVRCYANNTITVTASDITKIAFTFGSSDNSNTITANKGSFSTNTWTGTADEVVFTIGGTNGHRRIAAVEVTMNGVGETTVYSRYITSCQTTTELTEQPIDMRSARKVLIGGQIYLQVADGLYNMLGQKVN